MRVKRKQIRCFYRQGILVLAILGIWYWMTARPIRFHFPVEGKASWYSRHSPGIRERTANNEKFKDTDMTCALWGVRFNQLVKVTNRRTGESLVVRVNDRGPARPLVYQGRVIDLTQAAFSRLSPTKKGLIDVRVELVEEGDIDGKQTMSR